LVQKGQSATGRYSTIGGDSGDWLLTTTKLSVGQLAVERAVTSASNDRG